MLEQKSIVTLLVIAIGGLISAIVWLALYIRSLHKKQLEAQKDNLQVIVSITRDFTESNQQCKAAIESNTKSQDGLTTMVRDLHNLILNKVTIEPQTRRANR